MSRRHAALAAGRGRPAFFVVALALGTLLAGPGQATTTIGFEDVGSGLAPETAYRGEDGLGGFQSGGATFVNTYTDFGSFDVWEGFAYSNETNTTVQSFDEDTSAYAGGGAGGSATYAIGFASDPDPAQVVFSGATNVLGAYVTNATFTALAILNGAPPFSDPFGPDDFLKLTITGFSGAVATGSVDFYLSDYRNGMSLVVDDWEYVDLTSLGAVTSLEFLVTGSDNDPQFGLNTPAYFALDDLAVAAVPEPGTGLLVAAGLVVLTAGRARKSKETPQLCWGGSRSLTVPEVS